MRLFRFEFQFETPEQFARVTLHLNSMFLSTSSLSVVFGLALEQHKAIIVLDIESNDGRLEFVSTSSAREQESTSFVKLIDVFNDGQWHCLRLQLYSHYYSIHLDKR